MPLIQTWTQRIGKTSSKDDFTHIQKNHSSDAMHCKILFATNIQAFANAYFPRTERVQTAKFNLALY